VPNRKSHQGRLNPKFEFVSRGTSEWWTLRWRQGDGQVAPHLDPLELAHQRPARPAGLLRHVQIADLHRTLEGHVEDALAFGQAVRFEEHEPDGVPPRHGVVGDRASP
jgi:hypothetical protein